MTLKEQAVVLHLFSRTAREQGTIFCSPEDIESWFGDVLSTELEDFSARKMQQTFTELEASGHLVFTEVDGVVAWSLPNAVGPNCVCGCGCSHPSDKATCWPCWSSSKRLGPAGHIMQVLQMEQATHCDTCGGTLLEVAGQTRCAACGELATA